MFGGGWGEMLLIGVAALIFIGPKDLPIVMGRLGKMVATIRRLGGEFQREINKTTGLDQITDLRRSITEPLRNVATDITREFNRPLPNGQVEPTGIVQPTDPQQESVVDAIHQSLGMTPVPTPPPVAPIESPAPVEAIAPAAAKPPRKPRAKPAPKLAAAAAFSAATKAARLTAAKPAAPKPAAAKSTTPRKPRAAKPAAKPRAEG